ncbi:MAG TPA: 4-hydroxy-3-methylbut-2-enyl diphosphate reductase, partial [Bacteroidales bacterium]|nr:4-hydroxy-3-methylbut-2-enyl diphosphate reductase [Bacteroidales bacterium]
MKITIDSRSGFCAGVTSAIHAAEKELKLSNKLYCLG